MTLKQIAETIPAEYRKEIIACQMIENAIASIADDSMNYLFTIWATYVEPGIDMSCGLCIDRVLKNWKQLLPVLTEMEKHSNWMKALHNDLD